MARYLIGEVEKLTGVKAHVLRHWESIIPGFAPQKELNGRRIYSQRDIDIIQRLKYLVYTKGYTIEGAKKQLLQESTQPEAYTASLAAVHEIRAQLGEMYLMLKKAGDGTQTKQENEHEEDTQE